MIQHHSFKGILVDFDLMQLISLLQTQNVAYQLWQLMFVSPSGRKRIMVSDAAKLGYSFNNTLYRVYLRAPYHSNESDISTVSCCSQLDTKLYCFHYLPRTSVCLFFFSCIPKGKWCKYELGHLHFHVQAAVAAYADWHNCLLSSW